MFEKERNNLLVKCFNRVKSYINHPPPSVPLDSTTDTRISITAIHEAGDSTETLSRILLNTGSRLNESNRIYI